MSKLFCIKPYYLTAAGVLLLIEVLIAVFVDDGFVRPYLGDVLVILLIYSFSIGLFCVKWRTAALATLAFAILIEFCQFFRIVDAMDLRDNTMARIVLGTSFSWADILCYFAGFALIATFEMYKRK